MIGHLGSAVPGQRPAHLTGDTAKRLDDAGGDGLGGLVIGYVDQKRGAAGALDQCCDSGGARGADDEVAFLFLTVLVVPVRV